MYLFDASMVNFKHSKWKFDIQFVRCRTLPVLSLDHCWMTRLEQIDMNCSVQLVRGKCTEYHSGAKSIIQCGVAVRWLWIDSFHDQAQELLVEKCICYAGLDRGPGEILRTIFECVASGLLTSGNKCPSCKWYCWPWAVESHFRPVFKRLYVAI